MDDHQVRQIFERQVNARASKYTKYVEGIKALLASVNPRHIDMVRRANGALGRMKMLGPGQVHVDSILSSVSIQYGNGAFIGTLLMPVVPVAKQSDKYFIYDKRNRLAYPDDALGARGDANEINETRSIDNYSCQDYGLKNYVDATTLDNQDAPLNEMVDLVDSINEGMSFQEERRIAARITDPNSYPPSNKIALAASDRWDSPTGGNPVKVLQDARAALWPGRGPGILRAWSSLEVYNVLARHPQILDLFKYGGTAPGLATPQMIARFFGLDDYVIGEAREDIANEGQLSDYRRIWGNKFGITRVAARPSLRNASFGFTMRFGAITTDEWFDISKGRKGGYYARVGLSEDHKVVAPDTSYLIDTPIG